MKQLSSRIAYENPWMRLREDVIELADGSESIYGVIERSDFALVLPYEVRDGVEGFWMVEQFRYPVQQIVLEFPQGAWGKGKSGDKVALAHAELNEETGLRAERMEHVGRMFQSTGASTQAFDIFLATGLTQGEQALEPSEAGLVARFVPHEELKRMIRDGELVDSESVAGYAVWALRQA